MTTSGRFSVHLATIPVSSAFPFDHCVYIIHVFDYKKGFYILRLQIKSRNSYQRSWTQMGNGDPKDSFTRICSQSCLATLCALIGCYTHQMQWKSKVLIWCNLVLFLFVPLSLMFIVLFVVFYAFVFFFIYFLALFSFHFLTPNELELRKDPSAYIRFSV